MRRRLEDYEKVSFKFDGIYRGVVEDNNPNDSKTGEPLKDGRIKIRIWGLHTSNKSTDIYEGIPTDDLPLAYPALGLFEGSQSGFGVWTVPLNGSHVFVFFEQGNHMRPIYFASAPGIPKYKADTEVGFNDPNGEFPKENRLDEPDYHRLARGESDTTVLTEREDSRMTGISTPESSWDEPEPEYNAEYPNNKVIATHNGIVIEIDDTDENQRLHIYHPSKTYIEISTDGNLTIKSAGDNFTIALGDKNIYSEKSVNITAEKSVNIKTIKGDCNIISDRVTSIKGDPVRLN